ncbi:membrane protein [Microbacterium phage Rasputia]|nr:membrane protein [Microbacterium phage Rasputia]
MVLEQIIQLAMTAVVTHAMHVGSILQGLGEEGGTPENGTLIIDLLNMQWWQALIGIAAGLGLSPAPWILGLATNKIQFTAAANAAYAAREADLKAYHADVVKRLEQRYSDLEETNDKNVEALTAQKDRADKATSAVFETTEALRQASHVIEELRLAAQEVTPNGS